MNLFETISNFKKLKLTRAISCSLLCSSLSLFPALSVSAKVTGNGQEPSQSTQKQSPNKRLGKLTIDLNKLDTIADSCRITLVFANQSKHHYQTFHMDLAFFNQDEILEQRITVDAGPIRQKKTSIKEFEISALKCERIERILLNNIPNCELKSGNNIDCLDGIRIKSKSNVNFIL